MVKKKSSNKKKAVAKKPVAKKKKVAAPKKTKSVKKKTASKKTAAKKATSKTKTKVKVKAKTKKAVPAKKTSPKKVKKIAPKKASPKKKPVAIKKTIAKKPVKSKSIVEETEIPEVKKPSAPKKSTKSINAIVGKIRERLLENRGEVLKMLESSQAMERDVDGLTFSNEIDLASSLEGREMVFHLSSRDRKELKLIDGALIKIKNKTYGVCESCEKMISVKRLQILPLTALCIECQESAEHR